MIFINRLKWFLYTYPPNAESELYLTHLWNILYYVRLSQTDRGSNFHQAGLVLCHKTWLSSDSSARQEGQSIFYVT